MAELIPIQYRLRIAQRQQLEKWLLRSVVAVGVALASLMYAYVWERHRVSEHAALKADYLQKSLAIAQSQQVVNSRQELANRMQTVQQLMDDKTLLSLLRNISAGFSPTDSLEYISIDTHGAKPDQPKPKEGSDDHYVVRITGITASSSTLSDLVTRLSKLASPAMNVVLQSSHRDTLFDGQVMRFEILCEQPVDKGT